MTESFEDYQESTPLDLDCDDEMLQFFASTWHENPHRIASPPATIRKDLKKDVDSTPSLLASGTPIPDVEEIPPPPPEARDDIDSLDFEYDDDDDMDWDEISNSILMDSSPLSIFRKKLESVLEEDIQFRDDDLVGMVI